MNKFFLALFWIVSFSSFLFPRKVWSFWGRLLGKAFYYFLGSHRRYAETNVRFAFGDSIDEREVKKIAKESFETFGMTTLDTIKTMRFVYTGIENESKYISYEGMEHFESAKKQANGKGILLINAHFGLPEHANLFYKIKTERKLNFILRKMDFSVFQEVLDTYNKKFGITHYIKDEGLRPILKGLLKGEDLMIFPDQAANLNEGPVAKLFSKDATTISIVASLALKTGCPILPLFIFRGKDQISQTLVFFSPIIPSEDDTMETLVQKQNDAIEKAIRRAPNHWLWLHRRWKQNYPEIYKDGYGNNSQ
ncbi:MAG: hypothetical protein OCC45_05825 [Desulfotalea sp.]